jgi:hypothetical protein
MKKYLFKWGLAGLIMPVLLAGTFPFFRLPETLVLLFWPGSIVLLSLGAGPNTLSQVIYAWSIAVCLNIATYLFVGFLIRLLLNASRHTNETGL